MAMEVRSESFELVAASSPRFSFSNVLTQPELSPSRRLDAYLTFDDPAPMPADFDFSLSANCSSYDSSVADDLFSGGVLLPLTVRSSSRPVPATSAPEAPNKEASISSSAKRDRLHDVMVGSDGEGKNSSTVRPRSSAAQKSFWRFGRSSSLNCSSGTRAGRLCPFPLLRSKSTGSSPMRTAHTSSSYKNKYNSSTSNAPVPLSTPRKFSNDSNTRIYYYSAGNASRSYNCNGVRIGTILNVPTPCSMNIFSYLFCSCGYKS